MAKACCDINTSGNDNRDSDSNDRAELTIALAGNPNCGKSALFNALTGIRQKTGNWPGVTVDRKEGRFSIASTMVSVYDLPGIYSLDTDSLDEHVTRDYLLSHDADLIVNVVDANNLERNLYFTVQLLEMGVPIVLALNMMDVARKRGIIIDTEKLAAELGCPVIPVVATRHEGLDSLQKHILEAAQDRESAGYHLAHDEIVEQALVEIEPLLNENHPANRPANRHWLALKLLEGDSYAIEHASSEAQKLAKQWVDSIEQRSGEDIDLLILDTRFSHAHALTQTVIRERGKLGKTWSDRIDQLVLSPKFGVPIFLGVMYLMFLFTIDIGGAFIDFFDGVSGALFVDGFGTLLTSLGAPDWLRVILADGIGSGIQTVSTFIPIITALYLFLSVIEDSGYMARAAFVMDRFMRSIGLPGKAFVPLIVGFGCNVPAVMATRTLENERERKLTILMNPFMSCGARLPVYALFAAAFFPNNGQNLVFGLYLIGIIIAILTGLIMKRTMLSGESSGFMMELPPYHRPTLRGIMLRSWDRVRLFIKEAGQVIIAMVFALTLLNSIGTDGSFGNEDSDNSILAAVSREAVPVFAPMGIEENNWPAVLGIISGILAKEVVVGTLDSLYTRLANEAAGTTANEQAFELWPAIQAAAATVPENLSGLTAALTDPLGLDVGDLSSQAAAAEHQSVNQASFGAMVERFDGQVGAFAYLLFVLLYFPCVATIGAIKRETGAPWATFVAAWTTGIAYLSATGFYQVATFSQHPLFSSLWLGGSALFSIIVVLGLRRWGEQEPAPPNA